MKFFMYVWTPNKKNPTIHPYYVGGSMGLYGRVPFTSKGISVGVRWTN